MIRRNLFRNARKTAVTGLCLLGACFGHAAGVVTIDGHKAAADRVLARMKGGDGPGVQSDIEALGGGVSIERRSKLVPGLVVLSLEDGIGTASAGPSGDAVIRRIKQLRESGRFEYVEPDWVVTTFQTPSPGVPDDAAFTDGRLWGLRNDGQNGGTADIDTNVVPAWTDITVGDSDVVVGVVDTGIRFTHQDITDNMWVNEDEIPDNGVDDDGNGFVDDVFGINAIDGTGDPTDVDDHGTHVAGTIGATGNGGGPHVGVAFGSRLMGLKFLTRIGGFTSDAIEAIDYGVANGADILNNSWGGGGFSSALLDSIEAANEAGVLFIVAAGNDESDNDENPTYPANYEVPNVISVAALNRKGNLADFSNFGAETVDLAAPGVEIFSSTSASDESYALFQGTSMAAPHVAGVAALIKSAFPDAGVEEMRTRLLETVRPVAALDGKTVTGGLVDAEAALALSPDGVLELEADTPEPLVEGRRGIVQIIVTDVVAVTDATVTGSLDGGPEATFVNDGTGPDETAGDAVYSAEFDVPPGVTSTVLSVDVTAPGKDDASDNFVFNVSVPPANNDFADREVLAPGTNGVLGSNELADAEPGEPLHPQKSGEQTVWWVWNAPEDGPVTISTEGSTFDTTLAVYVGDSLSGLSLIAANDDAAGTFQSEVTFNAESGTSYAVQVNGFGAAEGDIFLNYPGPGSAEPGGVVVRSNPEDVTVRHNRSFTLAVEASGAGTLSYQWFRGLPSDSDPDEIPEATGPQYSVEFADATDAGPYFVRISNGVNTVDSEAAAVTVIPPDSPLPANDDFADAQSLTGSEATAEVTNIDATKEVGEPEHAGAAAPLSSVWYSWTAPDDGLLRLDLVPGASGNGFDTVLAVYTGSSVDALAEVAANDDDGPTTLSALEFRVSSGETYRIAVDGFAAAEGEVELNLDFLADGGGGGVAPNDAFADRIAISSEPGTTPVVTGSNEGATGEGDEPNHADASIPLNSIWWSWVAPVSGPVSISTESSDFDTTLAVYRGAELADLDPVAANDDGSGLGDQSEVRFFSRAGQTYQIAVDGFGGATGSVRLALSAPPPTGEGALFRLRWSGEGFGNDASATGLLGVDLGSLPNPTSGEIEEPVEGSALERIELTVSGSESGDGRFDASHFEFFRFDSGGDALDFSRDLVGQLGGTWGTTAGNFNLVAAGGSTAPDASAPFVLSADAGSGEPMELISFERIPNNQDRVLLVDAGAGFGGASDALTSRGYAVVERINEGPEGFPSLASGAFLDEFEWVVFAPRGGTGSPVPDAVRAELEAYVRRGGNLLVTGEDALTSPSDDALAGLLGIASAADSDSGSPTWNVETVDHPVLNGPFGDFRGASFEADGYDFEALTLDPASDAVVLARLPEGEPRLFVRPVGEAGGTVGYWNGGRRSPSAVQPDFVEIGDPRSLFFNYAEYVTGFNALDAPSPSGFADWLDAVLPSDSGPSDRTLDATAFGDGLPNLARYATGIGGAAAGAGPVRLVEGSLADPAVFVIDLRSDDPRLVSHLASSDDLTEWTRQALSFDAASGTWTLAPGPMALESTVQSEPGVWELAFRPDGYDSDAACFLKMEFAYDSP